MADKDSYKIAIDMLKVIQEKREQIHDIQNNIEWLEH
jgi:hypothetical protein